MMSLSIGVYEILGSCDVWHFLHHQHHRPPQSSHCNDESLISGIVIDFNFSSVSRTNILWKSPYCFSFIIDFQTSQLISVSSEKADTEWKFARSKLWISYFKVSHISRFFIVAFWSQFKVFHGHKILWHYELCDDDDSEGRDDDDDGDGDVESAGDNDWQVTVVLVVTQFLKEGGTVPPPFNIIPTLKVTNIIVTIILPPDYNLCNKHRWHLHNHHLPYHHLWPSEE